MVTSDTLDPIARPGQHVILAPNENKYINGDIVAVESENRKLLRRVWIQDDGKLLLESVNPLKQTSAQLIKVETANIRKVIGVLFEPRGSEFVFGSCEWNYISNVINIDKMSAIEVEGNSLDPIARDGQHVLIRNNISQDKIKDNMLAVIETTEHGRLIKRL